MASAEYNRFKYNLATKNIDWESDTIKIMIVSTSYTFAATHNQKSEIVAYEIRGTGYTAGGKVLTSKTVTQGATTKLDAADATWTSLTASSMGGAIVYDDDLANDDLICYIDFGEAKASTATDFTINFGASGVLTLT